MKNGLFEGSQLDKSDMFVSYYKKGDDYFPFSVVREYILKENRLVYSGKRIITCISGQYGTICFKLVAYKETFIPETTDRDIYKIDDQMITAINEAINSNK